MTFLRTFDLPAGVRSIPTTYRGIEFRSRTEAKWARALDLLGVTYEFEPVGLDLGPICYVPDFKLDFGRDRFRWVEIKGRESLDSKEIQCTYEFAAKFGEITVLHGGPDAYFARRVTRGETGQVREEICYLVASRIDAQWVALCLGAHYLGDVPAGPFDDCETYGEAGVLDTILARAASYKFEIRKNGRS